MSVSNGSQESKPNFPKSQEKLLPEGFKEGVESMDSEDIKKKIYECQCHSYEIQKERDEDHVLNTAKEELKGLMEPYKDALSTENAKMKYCFLVLEGRGVKLMPKSKSKSDE